MENRWSMREGERLAPLESLVYATRLIGGEPQLALWGGGNSSLKLVERDFRGEEVRVLRVKASGANMATIDASGFAGVRLETLLPLREREAMSDEEMVAYLDHTLMEPTGPRPSVETLLHAFVPDAAVLHSHADAILAFADASDPHDHIREAFGDRVVVVGYYRPGFPLAKAVWSELQKKPDAIGAILLHHGLVTWGASCKEAYDRHIELVSLAEAYVEARKELRFFGQSAPAAAEGDRRSVIAALMPYLRTKIFPSGAGVLRYDDSPEVRAFLELPPAAALAKEGSATPDHMLYTKRWPCFVPPVPRIEVDALKQAIDEAFAEYGEAYRNYVTARLGSKESPRDPYPRVLLIPGVGMVTAGRDWKEATVARDLYRQTLHVIEGALALGGYRSLSDDDAFEAEYWPLELRKLSLRPSKGELDGKVALVTGAARGIGRATARRLLEEGAHVVVADFDESALRETERELAEAFDDRCFGVLMDVTDEEGVASAFQEAVLRFGGLDILVSNAGIAPTGAVIDMPLAVWEKSFAVNSTGHFLVSREAVRVMKAQGVGGAIVFNCTKNVVVPGPEFGAYSCAKASEAQLARILALEHGRDKIRVNMVNPDSVFTDLWSPQVKQDRAAAYGIPVEKLEEHYRNRTLLKESVLPEDVAECILFLVSDRSAKTTGCMIPVDAGVREAFPR